MNLCVYTYIHLFSLNIAWMTLIFTDPGLHTSWTQEQGYICFPISYNVDIILVLLKLS